MMNNNISIRNNYFSKNDKISKTQKKSMPSDTMPTQTTPPGADANILEKEAVTDENNAAAPMEEVHDNDGDYSGTEEYTGTDSEYEEETKTEEIQRKQKALEEYAKLKQDALNLRQNLLSGGMRKKQGANSLNNANSSNNEKSQFHYDPNRKVMLNNKEVSLDVVLAAMDILKAKLEACVDKKEYQLAADMQKKIKALEDSIGTDAVSLYNNHVLRKSSGMGRDENEGQLMDNLDEITKQKRERTLFSLIIRTVFN